VKRRVLSCSYQGVSVADRRTALWTCSTRSAWPTSKTAVPANSPAASSSAWRWRARLFQSPRWLLADEPTANLDSKTAENLMQLLQHMNTEHNVTFIFSTHDKLVMDFSRRLIKLHDGRVVEDLRRE